MYRLRRIGRSRRWELELIPPDEPAWKSDGTIKKGVTLREVILDRLTEVLSLPCERAYTRKRKWWILASVGGDASGQCSHMLVTTRDLDKRYLITPRDADPMAVLRKMKASTTP